MLTEKHTINPNIPTLLNVKPPKQTSSHQDYIYACLCIP